VTSRRRAAGASKSAAPAIVGEKQAGSALERHLADSLAATGLPEPVREFRFHPPRMWRVDFAFVEQRLAVEIEGGIYRGGGHTTVNGIRRDIAKANQLMFDGWRLLRVHGDQVRSGEAVELIRQALEG
jgi:very-short-patch-repair endonuclease